MTRDELDAKIQDLTDAANGLDEPEKSFKLLEISRLKSHIAGEALTAIRQMLERMQLPNIQEMERQIAAAKDAIQAHETRVKAVNTAIGLLKTALKIAL